RDLMREIRALGGGNVMAARRKAPLPRGTLERAEEIYVARYGTADGRVTASFEIVYLMGWPHTKASKSLWRRGVRHGVSPTRFTRPNSPLATRPPSRRPHGQRASLAEAAFGPVDSERTAARVRAMRAKGVLRNLRRGNYAKVVAALTPGQPPAGGLDRA